MTPANINFITKWQTTMDNGYRIFYTKKLILLHVTEFILEKIASL